MNSDDTQPSTDENQTRKQTNEESASDCASSTFDEPHWSKLKKAAIGSIEPSTSSAKTPAESVKEHPPPTKRKVKPRLILSGRNKQYR